MSAAVLRLSGQGCQYWTHGHCWRSEAENPGWDQGVICLVLAALERTYDGALAAQESGVSGALAAWSRWGESVLASPWDCLDFQSQTGEDGVVCRFLRHSVCVLRLPSCAGRCPHFHPRRS
ncbi:MAG: hypothetical protein WHT64_06020 [Desulfomicrobiaceae bacterium]